MSVVAQIAYADLDPTLNSRFDFVGFDPRGVGSSVPSVKCGTDADQDAYRVANSFGTLPIGTPSDVDAVNQRTKHYVTSCLDHSGSNGITGRDFLASVGTVTVAKDLDVVRAVLGDAKLTYVGWSYGTSIGTQYAEQFPRNVRALLLDGDMDPEIGFAAVRRPAVGRLSAGVRRVRQGLRSAVSMSTREGFVPGDGRLPKARAAAARSSDEARRRSHPVVSRRSRRNDLWPVLGCVMALSAKRVVGSRRRPGREPDDPVGLLQRARHQRPLLAGLRRLQRNSLPGH